jgi:hypothetical protein
MSTLQKNLLLALVYSGVGMLFLGIVQPGFAMPLFPPVGIALAALILFGLRLWPGVLLGITLLEIAEILYLDIPPGWWGLLGIVPVELWQVLVGYWLTRRLTGFRGRRMLRLILLVAPLCSLCGAVPAMWILRASSLIAPGELWSSGLVWWLGDVLGILLFVPLMFIFLGRPRDYWRPLRVSVALPIGVTLALLIIAFAYVLGEERSQIKARFERDSQQVTATLNRQLANEEEMLFALGGLMRLKPDLSDRDWQSTVQTWMARHPGAQGFAWAPYVQHDERAAFEARMRRAGYAHFAIRDAKGNLAPKAKAYLPYIHLTPPPAAGERDLLGQDSAWLVARRLWADGSPQAMENEHFPIRSQGDGAKIVLYYLVQAEEGGAKQMAGTGVRHAERERTAGFGLAQGSGRTGSLRHRKGWRCPALSDRRQGLRKSGVAARVFFPFLPADPGRPQGRVVHTGFLYVAPGSLGVEYLGQHGGLRVAGRLADGLLADTLARSPAQSYPHPPPPGAVASLQRAFAGTDRSAAVDATRFPDGQLGVSRRRAFHRFRRTLRPAGFCARRVGLVAQVAGAGATGRSGETAKGTGKSAGDAGRRQNLAGMSSPAGKRGKTGRSPMAVIFYP